MRSFTTVYLLQTAKGEQMNIIGIAGLPRSGKDSLAELYMANDYFGVSLGDIVRNESKKRHANQPDPISVKNMTETSNYLRLKFGADFALKEALVRFEEAKKSKGWYKGLVIFSVRAPIEADFILKNGGKLIWVEADDEVRFKRSESARRHGETEQTLQEMLNQEALQERPQSGLPNKIQMNTSYVKKKATNIFENNGNDFEAFKLEAKKQFSI